MTDPQTSKKSHHGDSNQLHGNIDQLLGDGDQPFGNESQLNGGQRNGEHQLNKNNSNGTLGNDIHGSTKPTTNDVNIPNGRKKDGISQSNDLQDTRSREKSSKTPVGAEGGHGNGKEAGCRPKDQQGRGKAKKYEGASGKVQHKNPKKTGKQKNKVVKRFQRVDNCCFLKEVRHSIAVNKGKHSNVMSDKLPRVSVVCNGDRIITTPTIIKNHVWTLKISSDKTMRAIGLLETSTYEFFTIKSIQCFGVRLNVPADCHERELNKTFHATCSRRTDFWEYTVQVSFKAENAGVFKQTVVCAFESFKPYFTFDLGVRVDYSVSNDYSVGEGLTVFCASSEVRWEESDLTIKEYSPRPQILKFSSHEKDLIKQYSLNKVEAEVIKLDKIRPQSVISLNHLTYRREMHNWLYVEEFNGNKLLSRYNLRTSVDLSNSFSLAGAAGGLHFATMGTLFGRIALDASLTFDTPEGRMLLRDVQTGLFAIADDIGHSEKVYEFLIEDKATGHMTIKFDQETVDELKLKADTKVTIYIQMCVSPLLFAEQHWAIDQLPDLSVVLPQLQRDSEPEPDHDLKSDGDNHDISPLYVELEESYLLNQAQKQVVQLFMNPDVDEKFSPPVLVRGPFGSGKTFTLAHCVLTLVKNRPDSRVLISTHSNSAADLYVKTFLAPYAGLNGDGDVRVLRVYYAHRSPATVSEEVLQFCCLDSNYRFRPPTEKELLQANVIVSTLSTARTLYRTCKGTFTHIVIDEAAQAAEFQVLLALCLAGPQTVTVLAGDHMQMEPNMISNYGDRCGFTTTLIDRLFESYRVDHPKRVLLYESYRSHPVLTDFMSQLFYEGRAMSHGLATEHPLYAPLTFDSVLGEDDQMEEAPGYYNEAEVWCVVQHVENIVFSWPEESWGPLDVTSIGVLAPYGQQVSLIRDHLRKNLQSRVTVESINNVQGKEFRVVILSTVRTHLTCTGDKHDSKNDYGFLTNPKMLTTALTRAQSLVIVVGHPVTLSFIGDCQSIWDEVLRHCTLNGSLLGGLTYIEILQRVAEVNNKKAEPLAVDAAVFVPRSAEAPAEVDGVQPLSAEAPPEMESVQSTAAEGPAEMEGPQLSDTESDTSTIGPYSSGFQQQCELADARNAVRNKKINADKAFSDMISGKQSMIGRSSPSGGAVAKQPPSRHNWPRDGPAVGPPIAAVPQQLSRSYCQRQAQVMMPHCHPMVVAEEMTGLRPVWVLSPQMKTQTSAMLPSSSSSPSPIFPHNQSTTMRSQLGNAPIGYIPQTHTSSFKQTQQAYPSAIGYSRPIQPPSNVLHQSNHPRPIGYRPQNHPSSIGQLHQSHSLPFGYSQRTISPTNDHLKPSLPLPIGHRSQSRPSPIGYQSHSHHAHAQANQSSSMGLPQQGHPLRLPQQGHPLRLPQQGHPLRLPQQGHPLRLPQQGHPLRLPQQGHPLRLPQQGHPLRLPQRSQTPTLGLSQQGLSLGLSGRSQTPSLGLSQQGQPLGLPYRSQTPQSQQSHPPGLPLRSQTPSLGLSQQGYPLGLPSRSQTPTLGFSQQPWAPTGIDRSSMWKDIPRFGYGDSDQFSAISSSMCWCPPSCDGGLRCSCREQYK